MTIPGEITSNPFAYYVYPEGENVTTAITTAVATPMTVPMAASTVTDPNAKLDEAGNVPIIAAPLTNDENIGTVIEKAAIEPDAEKEKKFVKTGESVSERLNRYYGGKYANATSEEKEAMFEKYVTGHFETLKDKTREQQIKIQLADYKKLLSNTREGDDYEMMAKQIAILEEENQVPAAISVTKEASTQLLKKRGEIGVAKSIQNCCSSNQKALTDIVVQSKNFDAQKIGAENVSQLSPENQVYAHGAYFDIKTDDPKRQEELQTILTEQLGDYDVDAQLPIYEKTMESEFQSVMELAANNICNLDPSNQIGATQFTIDSGNEGAMRIAYANVGQCDPNCQQQMSQMLCEGAASYGFSFYTGDSETSTAGSVTNSTEFAELEVSEKLETISNAQGAEKENLIKELLKNPQGLEELIDSLTPAELYGIVNVLLNYDLSNKVMDKIANRIPQLDPKEQKTIMQKMNRIYSTKTLAEKVSNLDASSQIQFLSSTASKNATNPIDTSNFSEIARDFQKNMAK